MSTTMTAAGEALIARLQAEGKPLVIDRFIFAFVPGQDHTRAPNPAAGIPAGKVVHEYAIPEEHRAFVNPNEVVYSAIIGSDVGNFFINWQGLYCSEHSTLVAYATFPAWEKRAYDAGTNTPGNNLTRNFLLQFSGAREATQITVEAKVWQLDFTVRLKGIDERERLSNRDIYGRASFLGDAWLLAKSGSTYSFAPGLAYVEGIRAALDAALPVPTPALPCDVYLDVCMEPQSSDVVTVVSPLFVPTTGKMEDYRSPAPVSMPHYCEKVARINANGTVTDLRAKGVRGDTITPGSLGVVTNTDSRLSDARTPKAHATSHKKGGTDALTAADIEAAPAAHADDPAAHGATAELKKNSIVMRNEANQILIGYPTEPSHGARLKEVEDVKARMAARLNPPGLDLDTYVTKDHCRWEAFNGAGVPANAPVQAQGLFLPVMLDTTKPNERGVHFWFGTQHTRWFMRYRDSYGNLHRWRDMTPREPLSKLTFVYLDAVAGDDNNTGEEGSPLKTLAGLEYWKTQHDPGPHVVEVVLAPGTYAGANLDDPLYDEENCFIRGSGVGTTCIAGGLYLSGSIADVTFKSSGGGRLAAARQRAAYIRRRDGARPSIAFDIAGASIMACYAFDGGKILARAADVYFSGSAPGQPVLHATYGSSITFDDSCVLNAANGFEFDIFAYAYGEGSSINFRRCTFNGTGKGKKFYMYNGGSVTGSGGNASLTTLFGDRDGEYAMPAVAALTAVSTLGPIAAEGVAGIVPIASDAKTLAGTSRTDAVPPAGLKAALAAYATIAYLSPEYPVTHGTRVIHMHNLNLTPQQLARAYSEVRLVCKTAEGGYEPGEHAQFTVPTDEGYQSGVQTRLSTHYVEFTTGAWLNNSWSRGGVYVVAKTSGSKLVIDPAKWRFVFRIIY